MINYLEDNTNYEPEDNLDQDIADFLEPNLVEMDYEYIDYSAENETAQERKERKPKIPKIAQKTKEKKSKTQGRKIDPEIRKKYSPIFHEGNKVFKCNECEKTYATAEYARIHISSEHEGNKPMCTICAKTFSHINVLQKHIIEVHEKKTAAKCDKCDKIFTQKHALKRHIESVHEGKRPHLCTICGSSFAENKKLQLHIAAVHKKEKPFSCHLCGIRFARKDKLNVHIQAVHEGIKQKPRRPKSEGHVSNSGHLIENPCGHHQLDI